MAKKCRRCGYENTEDHYFCKQCGEPLDDKVRLIMDYERMKKTAPHDAPAVAQKDADEDYVYTKREPKKKSHAVVWIVVACLIVAGAAAAYFLFS